LAILKKKIGNEKTQIPDDVIMFLAESITNNIRELEGALIRLTAYASLQGMEINLFLARDILKDLLRETVKNVTIDTVQKKVAGFFNLNVGDFKAKRRNKNIVLARQVAMFLSRELTSFSLPEIGQDFGGKDHTTVLHAYNKIKEMAAKDPQFKQTINRIIFDIKS
jgi:chromosomal replication initiator protein